MNTRRKFHYKSGLYFLNFPSNVIQKTVFTDGFESMSSWKKYVYSDTWIPINNSQENTTQHHYPKRHADRGSKTTTICKDCHNYLHSKDK